MAYGDRTEARLAGPVAMSTSAATVSSAGSANHILKQVIFTNTSGAEALVYLGVRSVGGPATVANRVVSALPIAQNDVVVWDTALVISSYEELYGFADRSGVNVTVMGWIKEV